MAWKKVNVTLVHVISTHTGSDGGDDLEIKGYLDVLKVRDPSSPTPEILERRRVWDRPQTLIEDIALRIDKREEFILNTGESLLFTGAFIEEDWPSADDVFVVNPEHMDFSDINRTHDLDVYCVERDENDIVDRGYFNFKFKIEYVIGGLL